MNSANDSTVGSPFEVVTPPPAKNPRTPKSTPRATKKASGDDGAGNDGASSAEVILLIEMLRTVSGNTSNVKFDWGAIGEKLGLPSAGAAFVSPSPPLLRSLRSLSSFICRFDLSWLMNLADYEPFR